MTAQPPGQMHLQRSSRDKDDLPARLADWLGTRTGGAVQAVVTGDVDSSGMSSETVLLDIDWQEAGAERSGSFVLRMAPAPDDVPVFRTYRLDHQYDALRLVAELSDVPVPQARWLEPTGTVLGAPYFLMERIDGLVPPDVMPYTFGDNWLHDAPAWDRRRLQDATVDTIGQLHQIPDAARVFAFLDPAGDGRTPLHRHLRRTADWYAWAAADLGRSPLVERALAWLGANWPDADHPDNLVLSWGDSRIGNVLYRDFEPVGVLDWEMAGLGPRELDLGWLVFAHRVFQSLAEGFELPGLPDMLKADDVSATYGDLTGVEVGDLAWFEVYAAAIWGVVFMRTGSRQVHFGEIAMPDDVDGLFHHAPLFTALLDEVGA